MRPAEASRAPPPGWGLGLASQEGENCLRSGVGLGHGSHRSLLQHLSLGQIRRFRRHIRVTDAGLGGAEVGDLRLRQTDRVVELVLPLTDRGLRRAEEGDRRGHRANSLQRAVLALDRDVGA